MERKTVKLQRFLKGLSQYEVAAKTNWKVWPSEISLFERGLIRLNDKKLELLANALEIDKNQLKEA